MYVYTAASNQIEYMQLQTADLVHFLNIVYNVVGCFAIQNQCILIKWKTISLKKELQGESRRKKRYKSVPYAKAKHS